MKGFFSNHPIGGCMLGMAVAGIGMVTAVCGIATAVVAPLAILLGF